jgi:hypothetical protein
MNYDKQDGESWVVTAIVNKTRFFLTDEGHATDRLSRARIVRYLDNAQTLAASENNSTAWGVAFDWAPMALPAAVKRTVARFIARHQGN